MYIGNMRAPDELPSLACTLLRRSILTISIKEKTHVDFKKAAEAPYIEVPGGYPDDQRQRCQSEVKRKNYNRSLIPIFT
jgi:hypothetical protein